MQFGVDSNQRPDFIRYFVLSACISGINYMWIAWDLFGKDELLNPYQYYKNIVVTALILTGITAIFIVYFVKTNRRPAAMGLLLPALISVLIIARFGPGIITGKPYFEPFEKATWMRQKSVLMMRDLVHKKAMLGKTQTQTISALGKPDEVGNRDLIWYDGKGIFKLVLAMDKMHISNAEVQLIDP